MTTQTQFMVSLTVICDTQEKALRVVEVLSRPLVGLVLENTHGTLSVTPFAGDEEDK